MSERKIISKSLIIYEIRNVIGNPYIRTASVCRKYAPFWNYLLYAGTWSCRSAS